MHFIEACGKILSEFWSKSSGEFLSALAGAFFGALGAYYFQRSSERRKRNEEKHSAIVQAQMALIAQLNTLQNIEQQFLAKYRNDPSRELKMIMFSQAGSDIHVKFESLSFLLTTDHVNLVHEVHVAERAYISAMDSLASRNQAVERLHAKSPLQEMDFQSGSCTIKADPRDVKLVKDMTDALYTSVDGAYKKCDAAIRDLKAAGKAIFPKKRFLSAEEKK